MFAGVSERLRAGCGASDASMSNKYSSVLTYLGTYLTYLPR